LHRLQPIEQGVCESLGVTYVASFEAFALGHFVGLQEPGDSYDERYGLSKRIPLHGRVRKHRLCHARVR
jgi:hypothetical protein